MTDSRATATSSVEADRRPSIHCAMTGLDRPELVEQLVDAHLRRYVASDRGGGDSAGEVDGGAA
ncbi:hypothetical protein [Paludisphaera mucosa]|uniref:Uncharacterized protein n=1 Tax=Paludisphaera mucosa TaxID=3030827 RepID=A0ABT6FLN8_9BACT|nr:hypothetical protein [Paludisphaera mucosa]MDG3008495.1 hypothetical protein [Paludisphaera mucosa]